MHKHRSLATTVAFLTLCYSAPHVMAQESIDIGEGDTGTPFGLVTAGDLCSTTPNETRYIGNGATTTAPVGIAYTMSRQSLGEAKACFCHCIQSDGTRKTERVTIPGQTWTASEATGWEWSASAGTDAAQGQVTYVNSSTREKSVGIGQFDLAAQCQSKRRKNIRIDKQRSRTSMNAFIAHCRIDGAFTVFRFHTDDLNGQSQTTTVHYDKWTYSPVVEQSVLLPCETSDYQ